MFWCSNEHMSRVGLNKSSYGRNYNLIQNKIVKIRKIKIYKTIVQIRFNIQHNLQHNTYTHRCIVM